VRIHNCSECGYVTTRDVAASQEVRNRGLKAVGQIVSENVCGLHCDGEYRSRCSSWWKKKQKTSIARYWNPRCREVTEHSEVA
ncbi:MAG: RNA-guided endonuclease TnpB family protein, partial [Xenococcus sp. (in: cyanobacteria)]